MLAWTRARARGTMISIARGDTWSEYPTYPRYGCRRQQTPLATGGISSASRFLGSTRRRYAVNSHAMGPARLPRRPRSGLPPSPRTIPRTEESTVRPGPRRYAHAGNFGRCTPGRCRPFVLSPRARSRTNLYVRGAPRRAAPRVILPRSLFCQREQISRKVRRARFTRYRRRRGTLHPPHPTPRPAPGGREKFFGSQVDSLRLGFGRASAELPRLLQNAARGSKGRRSTLA